MKTIKVNKDGYVSGPYVSDATISIDVSDDIYNKTRSVPFYKRWKYNNGDTTLEDILSPDILRARRQKECFNLIDNRSQLWYNHLTDIQKQQLEEWYNAWLVVTETCVIPTKPEWLK